PFTSDCRGLVFFDTNRAVRLFGSRNGNRDQFNLAYFRQAQKDPDSLLNSFDDRGQNVVIANYYRQDFVFPGYTAEVSLHYNNDPGDPATTRGLAPAGPPRPPDAPARHPRP